jgi:hypothetical protein
MPYLGNTPSTSFATVVKDSFSGDGSTVAFTLSKVATTNSVSVFVENVRQEPTTAYAVSGTTLTFTAAPVTSSGNNIYVLHMNPTTTTTHPSAQNLTAVNGTLTGTLAVTGTSTLTGNVALGGTLDMNGAELVLDADADTSITADTDDQIDIKIAGADDFQFTANTFTAQSGSTIAAQALTATTITASGIIKTDDATDATSTTDGSLQTDGGLSVVKDAVFGDDVKLLSDSAVLSFGADSEVTLTHSADVGLLLKHTATADDKAINLILQTGETDIELNDVLGAIKFQAPDEGTGTDAILIAAQIHAVSEGNFSSSNNATALVFATGASEAATEKMRIDSSGRVGIGVTDPTQYNSYGNGLIIEKSSTSGSAGMSLISATNGYGSIYFNDGTGNNTVGRIEYYHGSGQQMGFAVEGTQRLKIASNGNLGVTADADSGTAVIVDNDSNSQPFGLAVRFQNANDDNNTTYFFRGQDSAAARFTVFSDGDVNTADAGTLSSDSKNKNTITDATGKWDDVKKLQVRNFYWNEAYHPNKKDKKMIGFIAQEFETVFPGLVNDLKDTNIKNDKVVDLGTTTKVIKEGKLIPILTKALQEAMTRIETLEAEVAKLKE